MHRGLKWAGIWLGAWSLSTVAVGVFYTIVATVGTVGFFEFLITLFLLASINTVVLAVCGVLYATDREKTGRIAGAAGVVLILVIGLGPLSASSPESAGPPYSGTVASEDPLNNLSQSHTLTLNASDRVTIAFQDDAHGYWSIDLPTQGQTISGRIPARRDYSTVENVEHESGRFTYTANQSGTHEISVSATVYESVSYRISVTGSNGQ